MREGLVYHQNNYAGRIIENDDSHFEFIYDDIYFQAPTPAISVTLPKTQKNYQSDRLFGFFDGLIPEGWLLDLVTHNFAIKAKDRMGLLLTTCSDAIGAVSVIPTVQTAEKMPQAKPSSEKKTHQAQQKNVPAYRLQQRNKCLICTKKLEDNHPLYHPKCVSRLFMIHQNQLSNEFIDMQLADIETLAQENINRRLALTGAQQKISVSLTPIKSSMRLTVLSDSGLFILKPPPEKFPDFPMIEHASMLIAKNLGLVTADFGLIPFASGELGYITRRFDRQFDINHPEKMSKLSMEDFGQIFNRNIEADKYRGSYNQVAKWLRQHAKIPGETAIRFFSQIYLAFLIGNNDLHLKNLAILTDGGIRLTPIFDFVSTQLIDYEPEVDLTLPVNGRDRKIHKKDWLVLAQDLGLKQAAVENIFQYFHQKWPVIESTIRNSFLSLAQQEQLLAFIQLRLNRHPGKRR